MSGPGWSTHAHQERQRRLNMWHGLLARGGPSGVAPALLRALGIYGGAQGVWVDKTRTGSVSGDGSGATVGLLRTGSSYPDDLSADGVLCHYPKKNRPPGRDKSEINATRAAGALGLPVFIITYPAPNSMAASRRPSANSDWMVCNEA